MWDNVARWFEAEAERVTVVFIPDKDSAPIEPDAGYVRLWLSEGFLGKSRTWGNDHYPALHGGATLQMSGYPPAPFTTMGRPKGKWAVPGAQFGFQITPLLPFGGGVVEVEAALYQVSAKGPLATAVGLVGRLASLMGPPLATAANIAGKVSEGLDAVLEETGGKPVLGLHYSFVSPGGGGTALRAGHLAVVNAPDADPMIVADRIRAADGSEFSGVDYLVVRVECRTDHDSWHFPDLDKLIYDARAAYQRGWLDAFEDQRTEAIARTWNSRDLAPADQPRVALLVTEMIDAVKVPGAVPDQDGTLCTAAPARLLAREDPALNGLRLNDLLTTG